jgi:acetyltransferase-like isoleucine patch superfamily enzyme
MLIQVYRKIKTILNGYAEWLRVYKLSIKSNIELGERVSIGKRCSFSGRITIGNNVSFVENIRITGIVSIGSNVIIAANVIINSRNHDFSDESDALPYGTSYIIKEIIIEDNVWIGNNVILLPGVKISEGAIIGAGSVVTKNVGMCEIAGGNPARVLKNRDVEHYMFLKGKNIFLNDIRGYKYFNSIEEKKIIKKLRYIIKKKKIVYDFELFSEQPHKVRGILYSFYINNNNILFGINDEGVFCKRENG